MKPLTLSARNIAAALAVLCIGAFVLALGTLAWRTVPEGNRELFSQGWGALTLLLGFIARHYWPDGRSSDEEPRP